MELTKERAIEEHRKMWNWIADQYEKVSDVLLKYHYIDALKEYYIRTNLPNLGSIASNCFCCEYDEQYEGICENCPLEWGGEYIGCLHLDNGDAGLYELIDMLTDEDSCKNDFLLCGKIARQIANLPERHETEEV